MTSTAAATPWYDFPVTRKYSGNPHGGEVGIDLGTREGTPVSFPFGGTVEAATYGAPGGFVGVLTTIPGVGQVTEYLLHLDQILPGIRPGAQVGAGQVIGLSGGEVGGPTTDTRHPASPALSGGPHVEFGLFNATNLSNAHWWDPNAGTVNPTGVISGLRSGSILSPVSGPSTIVGATDPGLTATGNALGVNLNPADWVNAIKAGLAGFVIDVGIYVLALAAIGLGALLIFWPQAKEAGQQVAKAGADAAKAAAVAAA